MSARKLSDKEFDRYVRNIIKKPEGIPFDEKAWASIEAQIVPEGTSSSVSYLKWLIPFIGALMLILGYLGYTFLAPSQDKLITNENTIDYEDDVPNVPQDAKLSIANDLDHTSKVDVNAESESPSVDDSSADPAQLLSSKAQDSNITFPLEKVEQDSFEEKPTSTKKEIGQNETLVPSNTEASKEVPPIAPILEKEEITETASLFTLESIAPKPELANEEGLTIIPLEQQQNLGGVVADTTSSGNEKELSKSYSPWRIGLVVAPDFSTVEEFSEFTNPGLDVGITVEYFFNSRLSLTSGAILTQKLYNTTELSEYEFPAGFWRNGLLPEEVRADCDVIDIPVNLRYRLFEGKRTSLFASAGVSSYLMLTEQYNYYYDENSSRADWVGPSEFSNENRHFFAVYNLSMGITRQVLPKVSLEVEPFIKNSLGDVGWGQVQLRSTGVLFHLKYHFREN